MSLDQREKTHTHKRISGKNIEINFSKKAKVEGKGSTHFCVLVSVCSKKASVSLKAIDVLLKKLSWMIETQIPNQSIRKTEANAQKRGETQRGA